MQVYRTSLFLLRITVDIFIIILAFVVSAHISIHSFNFFRNINGQFLLLALLIIWFFTTKTTRLYDEFRSRNITYEVINLIKNVVILPLSAIIILFLLKEQNLSREFVAIFSVLCLILLTSEKIFVRKTLNIFRGKGRNLRNLLIIGAGKVGDSFYNTILRNPHFGYKVTGFLDDKNKAFLNGQYLGKIEELENVLSKYNIDDVIIALPNYAIDKIENIIYKCENRATRVRIIPDYFKLVSPNYNISMFGNFPIISVRSDKISELHWRILKRLFDIVFTFLIYLFVFSWLWPIIFLLQLILNPGPIFYKASRWGRKGKEFNCYKFRSMTPTSCNSDNDGKHVLTNKSDNRITKFGGFLRRTNLDELPQFWNVLKGDMSIVGPRPHDAKENVELKGKINAYMYRHIVKPGVTGWAQVNGYRGGTADISLMKKRTDYDLWYIENWSFWLDIQIVLMTIWKTIKGDPNAY